MARPSVSKDVVGISCGILVALFALQFFGTKRVGFTFAPIVFIWLSLLGVSGIINICKFPGVFRGATFGNRRKNVDLGADLPYGQHLTPRGPSCSSFALATSVY